MKKIASPQELTHELRSLLAYAESESPSREKLAADLSDLASRVAGDKLADTEVWLNVGNGFVTVAVVGIDDRMISSVESALKSEAEDHGADIDDNNPREVERFLPKSEYGAASYAYTGFSAEGNGDPSDTRDLVARLKKEAEQHSWVGNVRIQRGWPRI